MKARNRTQAKLAVELKHGLPTPDEFSFSKRLRRFKLAVKKFYRRMGRRLDKEEIQHGREED